MNYRGPLRESKWGNKGDTKLPVAQHPSFHAAEIV